MCVGGGVGGVTSLLQTSWGVDKKKWFLIKPLFMQKQNISQMTITKQLYLAPQNTLSFAINLPT